MKSRKKSEKVGNEEYSISLIFLFSGPRLKILLNKQGKIMIGLSYMIRYYDTWTIKCHLNIIDVDINVKNVKNIFLSIFK